MNASHVLETGTLTKAAATTVTTTTTTTTLGPPTTAGPTTAAPNPCAPPTTPPPNPCAPPVIAKYHEGTSNEGATSSKVSAIGRDSWLPTVAGIGLIFALLAFVVTRWTKCMPSSRSYPNNVQYTAAVAGIFCEESGMDRDGFTPMSLHEYEEAG